GRVAEKTPGIPLVASRRMIEQRQGDHDISEICSILFDCSDGSETAHHPIELLLPESKDGGTPTEGNEYPAFIDAQGFADAIAHPAEAAGKGSAEVTERGVQRVLNRFDKLGLPSPVIVAPRGHPGEFEDLHRQPPARGRESRATSGQGSRIVGLDLGFASALTFCIWHLFGSSSAATCRSLWQSPSSHNRQAPHT